MAKKKAAKKKAAKKKGAAKKQTAKKKLSLAVKTRKKHLTPMYDHHQNG